MKKSSARSMPLLPKVWVSFHHVLSSVKTVQICGCSNEWMEVNPCQMPAPLNPQQKTEFTSCNIPKYQIICNRKVSILHHRAVLYSLLSVYILL